VVMRLYALLYTASEMDMIFAASWTLY